MVDTPTKEMEAEAKDKEMETAETSEHKGSDSADEGHKKESSEEQKDGMKKE